MVKLIHLLILSVCIILAGESFAQIPSTSLYKFDYEVTNNTIQLSNPQFLSAFNLEAYNNQPFVVNRNKVYISAQVHGSSQTDILQLDLIQKRLSSFTATASPEYSPKKFQNRLYCVRVLPENDQFLWVYPLDGNNSGKTFIPNLTSVGYFEFLSEMRIALFLVGTPNKLVIHDIQTSRQTLVSENPGRTLQRSSDGQLLYVEKFSDDFWYIKKYDPKTFRSKIIAQTPGQNEDFVMLDEELLLIGRGTELLKFNPKTDGEWIKVADLKNLGIEKISRLASNDGILLLVSLQE